MKSIRPLLDQLLHSEPVQSRKDKLTVTLIGNVKVKQCVNEKTMNLNMSAVRMPVTDFRFNFFSL